MSIDISGEVRTKLRKIGMEMRKRSARASEELKNTELRVLRGQRSGAQYKKSFKSTRYTASAPGEPPAVRTGKLRNSFRGIAASGSTFDILSVTVGIETDANYARYLDEGTRKMAARPYVEKIKKEALPGIEKIYNERYNV